jgi:hypothetical protein
MCQTSHGSWHMTQPVWAMAAARRVTLPRTNTRLTERATTTSSTVAAPCALAEAGRQRATADRLGSSLSA